MLGQRHDTVPVTGQRHRLNEPALAEMPEVGGAWIAGPAEAGLEVARGDDSERADRRQHAALVAVDLVVAVSDADRLPTGAAREIHVADRDVARVARRPRHPRVVGGVAAAAQVWPSVDRRGRV